MRNRIVTLAILAGVGGLFGGVLTSVVGGIVTGIIQVTNTMEAISQGEEEPDPEQLEGILNQIFEQASAVGKKGIQAGLLSFTGMILLLVGVDRKAARTRQLFFAGAFGTGVAAIVLSNILSGALVCVAAGMGFFESTKELEESVD